VEPTREASLSTGAAGRISFSGLCSIAAVLAVVVVVSVPRLGRIALAENDSDARVTSRFLADALEAAEGRPDSGRMLALPGLRTLNDARPDPGGTPALAYHGYLFEVVTLPAALLSGDDSASPDDWAVRARPGPGGESHGRTYLACPQGVTFALAPGGAEDDIQAWRRVD
jgi:hypothetical protein